MIAIIVIVIIGIGVLVIGYGETDQCGDGICQKIEEEKGDCPQDCIKIPPEEARGAVCGNNVCEDGEDVINCPKDCEPSVAIPPEEPTEAIKPPSESFVSKTCAELNGYICDMGEDCRGKWLDEAVDTFSCCSQSCKASVNDIIDIDTFELTPENEDLGDIN